MSMPDESVNGIVIGEVSAIFAQLYYDDRPQCAGFWVSCYDHACLSAKKLKEQIKQDMGEAYTLIYPNDSLWNVHIHGAK